MDIKSLIDSEDTPPSRRQSAQSPTKPENWERLSQSLRTYEAKTSGYDKRGDVRPPQPAPLQTPRHSDLHFRNGSSSNPAYSPYQITPSSSFSGGQYPSPQHSTFSPAKSRQVSQYQQPESLPAPGAPSRRSIGHTTPLSQTPTASTPGSSSAYPSFARPTSSHSATTPHSAQQHPGLMRESPQSSHTQLRSLSQTQTGPLHMSQPGTPLGPPSVYGRPSLSFPQESPENLRHHRTLSGGSYSQPNVASMSPPISDPTLKQGPRRSQSGSQNHANLYERERSLSVSPKTRLPSLPAIESVEANPIAGAAWTGQVTPAKRKADSNMSEFGRSEQITRPTAARVNSVGINGLLNAEPTESTMRTNQMQNQTSSRNIRPSHPTHPTVQSDEAYMNQTFLQQFPISHNYSGPSETPITSNPRPNERPSIQQHHSSNTSASFASSDSAPRWPSNAEMSHQTKPQSLPIANNIAQSPSRPVKRLALGEDRRSEERHQSIKLEDPDSSQIGTAPPPQPANKKPRLDKSPSDVLLPSVEKPDAATARISTESLPQPIPKKPPRLKTPIFAQSFRRQNRHSNGNPMLPPHKRTPLSQRPPSANQVATGATMAQGSDFSNVQSETNGHNVPPNGVNVPPIQATLTNTGPLGPWEPSILNIIPSEELVKVVSDWLFAEVVLREDVGVGPAGGAAGQGAVLEIEAKIGQLIDKNTNDRLRLPVISECVISQSDPNVRVAFKSSMTEAQHRALNGFLNKALVASQPPVGQPSATSPSSATRIPMSYKHTYECDTFYDLTQSGALALPGSIAAQQGSRYSNKAKVRITTDQRTGKEIAKIIKARIADIDIYSPRTAFDWRISVNVEMNFLGDMKGLVETERKDGRRADRNKDRMSYKHLAYQVDLTQVTPADATSKTEKEHELEIEVSSAEVRRQGLLARDGQVSQYEDLIRGFVDNVRVLARHCQ